LSIKEEELAEMRESISFDQQSLEKSIANVEAKDKRIQELEQEMKTKNSIEKEVPKSEETVEKLTEEIAQQKVQSDELKQQITIQTKTIHSLESTLQEMKSTAAHKERLAGGFQKKAIQAMRENKEFSQTLQNYRNEVEEKTSIITELAEKVEHLIRNEAALIDMNTKLEGILQNSMAIRKESSVDLKSAFMI